MTTCSTANTESKPAASARRTRRRAPSGSGNAKLPKCSANFTAAVPSRIERRALSALSKCHHDIGKGIREPQFIAAFRYPPTLFKRPDASYPPAREDMTMKLGLAIGYSGAHLDVPVALVQRAEELGYDSVWSAEAYGSDAITPLAFLAGKTNRIKLGTGIMQLAARTPANAAMSAASIDAMAGGGRFIAGLGVSGPQIVEGWYGQPWGKPYYRVKDYVTIMRKIFKREGPVTHEGREISLPYKGEGSAGLAKPLKSILHMNPDIPIFLATGGESMVKLTAEIADGWLPIPRLGGQRSGLGQGAIGPARGRRSHGR